MKKRYIILVAAAFTFTFTGCKKDEAEKSNASNNNGGGTSAAFACKIDGTAFTADSTRVNTYNGGFSIMAFKNGATTFELNLKEPAVGNHSFAAGSGEAATYITASAYFANQSGQLTVTAFDAIAHKTSGSFSFVGANGADTKTITEGVFDIQ